MKGIIVHGGAWNIPKELHAAHLKGCKKAVEIGYEYLDENSLKAVTEAIAYMEDDETFDAGVGSFLNEDGEVEMDAIVFDGKNRRFGSVCAVRRIKNPVRIANLICNEENFSILVGEGAEKYASERGFELIENKFLVTEREIKRWKEMKGNNFKPSMAFSTVGCVAVDADGNISSATSTGGTPMKKRGRVGDTPIPGAGTYATPFAGASSTGYGEAILRAMLAKNVCDLIERRYDVFYACKKGIEKLAKFENGFGGVISMNSIGEYGFSFNTPYMAIAFKNEEKSFCNI